LEMETRVNPDDWIGSAWQSESTFHQLSPYIGKTKSSMAASLVARFSKRGDILYDPFSGCGTLAFEAWVAGRHVIANDLSPYAHVLTRAKLFPYHSAALGLRELDRIASAVSETIDDVDLRKVPVWVRRFFHPETLREAIAWSEQLRAKRHWFLLSCLLGILHHQRPGFLSFPSSHTVPYLRINKFPRRRFPELYEYRSLRDRLEAKVVRAFRRVPELDFQLTRRCFAQSADKLTPPYTVDCILTSPPYMRQLDYGRDNRLRLWFLGIKDWHSLDNTISPREQDFLALMERCFRRWKTCLKPRGYCVLVIGDECSREDRRNLPRDIIRLATEIVGGFSLVWEYTETIPCDRRVRRGITGSASETILVFRNARALSR
jgi:D12 class N6 adenine-specific DNA methyltransferase